MVNTEAALFIEHSAWLNDAEAAKTMVDAAMKGSTLSKTKSRKAVVPERHARSEV